MSFLGIIKYIIRSQRKSRRTVQVVSPKTPEISGKVRWVVDGDTLYITGYKQAVRLWGVDAPEQGDWGYAAAKSTLIKMAYGKYVSCRVKETDKYGRLVARCFLVKGGQEINQMMIETKTTKEFSKFSGGFYKRQINKKYNPK